MRRFLSTQSAARRLALTTHSTRSSDESVGTIEISWVGPRTHDWVRQAALSTAWGYLAGGDSSPAAKEFVNIPEAYCTGIGSNMDLRDPTIATIMLSNVPAKHLDTLAPRFIGFIKDQCLGPLDMKRMTYLLKQRRLSLLETLETDASSYVQGSALQDILYGADDGSQFSEVFRDLDVIEKLQTFTEDDWLEVLEECISQTLCTPARHRLTLWSLAAGSSSGTQLHSSRTRLPSSRRSRPPTPRPSSLPTAPALAPRGSPVPQASSTLPRSSTTTRRRASLSSRTRSRA